MRLIRIFLIILFFILVLNPVLLVAANEDEIITVEAEHVHVHYIANAIIPPLFGTGTVNRSLLVHGDYIPLYVSNPSTFEPYPISQLYDPPYKFFSSSAEGLISICQDESHFYHDSVLQWYPMANALLNMDNKKNEVRDNLESSSIDNALDANNLGISSCTIKGENPSSVWKYDSVNSLQNLYNPNYLMQQDDRIIAPMNQWNSITYNPSEDYIEVLDELLHPVPDMSFLDGIFATSGPLGDMAGLLADVGATPYTFLPAIFMLGMDIYLRSQNEIGFLYPTSTDYEISPCPESGMIMIKNNEQQMVYNITEGEGGSIANIPSGDFGTFFVDAVNSFSASIRPIASLVNDDLANGGRVQYNNVPFEYQSQDYSLNLESHVGISQTDLELCDTVIYKIQGSGTMIMLPFKIGCWFQCEQGQTGNIKSKTTVGVRFKDDEKYYTYDLVDCVLENINSVDEAATNQDGILMWSGVISINAEEYGKSEIEEIYLALSSSAKKTSGLNKVNCYTSLSFSPYFLNPIITLPRDIESFPGEKVNFQTELLEGPANATVNVSWEIPTCSETLEGYEVSRAFNQSGVYDCKLIVDPEYNADDVTDPGEIFWNTDAGKITFPFQVKILPSMDLKVDWKLPAYVPLNTRNHPESELYPERETTFTLYVTNEGVKDFHNSEYQDVPLKLSLFIDNNYNHYFDPDEKIWEEEIDNFPANSSKFYPVELLFSLDKNVDDTTDETVVYWPNFHDCQLQVSVLEEEESQENNVIRDTIEFISSPELDFTPPDFAVENAYFSIDQYNNIEVNFDLAEKSEPKNIINKWNEYHEDDPFIPQWGPIPYELWLRDSLNNVNILLDSEQIATLNYQERKSIQLDRLNLYYVSPGSYNLYLGINPEKTITESSWDNNHGFMGWFTLTDDRALPWYTKGGDRGHTGWKNIDLKPPLITDWVVDTSGIPVDIVCNSDSFYVLTSSDSIEKYNASGELQYTVPGFDGTPLWSSTMLLIYPDDIEKERLLAFSDDYRLVLINTQTGDKIWTSNHRFTETTFGSKPNLNEYCRTLDFDGRYLIVGWPITLYRFDSNMDVPILLWEKDKSDAYNRGEAFIIGNNILAGWYLYNLNGEELERFKWMDEEAILYLRNLYTNRNRYDYISQELTEMENLKHPESLFSNKILCGNKMLLDNQGNELWMLPNKIKQEYYPQHSTTQSIPVSIRSKSIINLWNGSQGYAYCINNKRQLLAVDLQTGIPVWYREFFCLFADLREKIPPFMLSLLRKLNRGVPYGHSYLIGNDAVNIQKLIPFQNSLLVGTIDNKIYRLSSSQLHHFEVQGYIPSIFYGPSRLKVRVQAFNEQGAEILLEDKITVTGDYIDQNNLRYYYIQEEISLPIGLPDSEMIVVDYPDSPYIVNNNFNFVDVQTLSPRVSIPLVVNNIQSRRRIRKYKAPAGEESVLFMDDEAQLKYIPKSNRNTIFFYYTHCDKEEISQVVHEHSYRIGVGINDARNITKDYEAIDLHINLPEGIDTNYLEVKINDILYDLWSVENNNIIIHCLNAFLELETKYLTIILIKT